MESIQQAKLRFYLGANKAFGRLAATCIQISQYFWKKQREQQHQIYISMYSKKREKGA